VSSVLLPPELRRPAVVLVGAGAALTAILGLIYHGQQTYGSLDSWVVTDVLAPFRGHRRGLWLVERLASPPSAVMLAVVLALVASVLRAWRCAVLAVLGLAATGILVELLKVVIGRTLFGNLALPSGHTAGAASLATTTALLVLTRVRARSGLAGAIALVGVTVVAAAVGLAMTALRLHYATDTVAGWGIGLAATLSVALGIDAAAERVQWGRPAPSSGSPAA
jgi:membrane-associated phospholipid phosphatase